VRDTSGCRYVPQTRRSVCVACGGLHTSAKCELINEPNSKKCNNCRRDHKRVKYLKVRLISAGHLRLKVRTTDATRRLYPANKPQCYACKGWPSLVDRRGRLSLSRTHTETLHSRAPHIFGAAHSCHKLAQAIKIAVSNSELNSG